MPGRKRPRRRYTSDDSESDSEAESALSSGSKDDTLDDDGDYCFTGFSSGEQGRPSKRRTDIAIGSLPHSTSSFTTTMTLRRSSRQRTTSSGLGPSSRASTLTETFSSLLSDEENVSISRYSELRMAHPGSLKTMGWVQVRACRVAPHGRECWTHPSIAEYNKQADPSSLEEIHYARPWRVPKFLGSGYILRKSRKRSLTQWNLHPWKLLGDRWYPTRAGHQNKLIGQGMICVLGRERRRFGLVEGLYDPNGVAEAYGEIEVNGSGLMGFTNGIDMRGGKVRNEAEDEEGGSEEEKVSVPSSSQQRRKRRMILSRPCSPPANPLEQTAKGTSSIPSSLSTEHFSPDLSVSPHMYKESPQIRSHDVDNLKQAPSFLEIYHRIMTYASARENEYKRFSQSLTSTVEADSVTGGDKAASITLARSGQQASDHTAGRVDIDKKFSDIGVQTTGSELLEVDDKAGVQLAIAREELYSARLAVEAHEAERRKREKEAAVRTDEEEDELMKDEIEFDNKDAGVQVLIGTLEAITMERDQYRSSLLKKDEEMAGVRQDVVNAEKRLEELRGTIIAQDREIQLSVTEKVDALVKVDGLITKVTQPQEAVDTYRSEKDGTALSLSALRKQVAVKDLDIKSLEEEKVRVAARLGELKAECETQLDAVARKDAELVTSRIQRDEAVQRAIDSTQAIQKCEEMLKALQKANTVVLEEKEAITKQLLRAREENEKLAEEKNRAATKVGQLVLEKDELAEEVIRMRREIAPRGSGQ
ncbi:hypothetical protein IAU59_006865 [Kwoniella sp. CBS 9459]